MCHISRAGPNREGHLGAGCLLGRWKPKDIKVKHTVGWGWLRAGRGCPAALHWICMEEGQCCCSPDRNGGGFRPGRERDRTFLQTFSRHPSTVSPYLCKHCHAIRQLTRRRRVQSFFENIHSFVNSTLKK